MNEARDRARKWKNRSAIEMEQLTSKRWGDDSDIFAYSKYRRSRPPNGIEHISSWANFTESLSEDTSAATAATARGPARKNGKDKHTDGFHLQRWNEIMAVDVLSLTEEEKNAVMRSIRKDSWVAKLSCPQVDLEALKNRDKRQRELSIDIARERLGFDRDQIDNRPVWRGRLLRGGMTRPKPNVQDAA